MIELSRHFVERWRERVGSEPSPRMVMDIIRDPGTVVVQRGRDLQVPWSGRMFRQAAIYWSPALDVVIKVDEVRKRAITVLARRNRNGRRKVA